MLFSCLFQNFSMGMGKGNMEVIDVYNLTMFEDARGVSATAATTSHPESCLLDLKPTLTMRPHHSTLLYRDDMGPNPHRSHDYRGVDFKVNDKRFWMGITQCQCTKICMCHLVEPEWAAPVNKLINFAGGLSV